VPCDMEHISTITNPVVAPKRDASSCIEPPCDTLTRLILDSLHRKRTTTTSAVWGLWCRRVVNAWLPFPCNQDLSCFCYDDHGSGVPRRSCSRKKRISRSKFGHAADEVCRECPDELSETSRTWKSLARQGIEQSHFLVWATAWRIHRWLCWVDGSDQKGILIYIPSSTSIILSCFVRARHEAGN
jgi:hypothetical protein